MKKHGYTLIEIMVSIFILTVLFSAGMSQSKFANNLVHDMEKTDYVYEIQNIISYGKAMCREKSKYGEIIIDYKKKEIRFIEGWDNIEKIIQLPQEVKIIPDEKSTSIDSKEKKILIDPEGKIKVSTTITLVDKYMEKQYVSIGVGGDLVTIKESGIS